jgi:protein involved in polysaccharide export with SLBB domain
MVGIDLDKAVLDPGSIYDVVLREGDELVIPQYSNTVRIDGAVLNPNEVTFESSRRVKYYVDQAGGYSNIAKKRKAYMISMNGHITKARKRTKVEPGAEIIVPQKEKRPGSLQSILGVATTAASLGTMAASIANILK